MLQRTYNAPTTNYWEYNILRRIFASRLTLTAIQNLLSMYWENRPVAPVIEKTVYESNDCHYEVSPRKRVSSTLIQKIISVIFGIMSLGHGIVSTNNDTQLEIIRHTTLYSNAKLTT